MAAPFGGYPTLARYIGWARNNHGCTAQSGVRPDADGRIETLTVIRAPSGRRAVVLGQQEQVLPPTMVGYLDRRLGIESPFASLDDAEMDPE